MMSSNNRTNKNEQNKMGQGDSKPGTAKQPSELGQMVDAESTGSCNDSQLGDVFMMLTTLDKLPALLDDAKTEIKSLVEKDQVIRQLQMKVEELDKKLKSTEQASLKEVETVESLLRHHMRAEADYKVKYENASAEVSKEKASNRTLTEDLARAKANINRISGEKQNLFNKIDGLKTENGTVTKELSDCKSRLSKLLSNKLTENNPQIADLSDPNRPTKLAEKHSELYDNQWTDAFAELQKSFDEEQSIKKLFACLTKVHEFCKEKATEQVKQLKQVAYMRHAKEEKLSDTVELKALIKEIRKHTAELSVPYVYKDFASKYPQYSSNPDIWKYVEECVKLCWLMNAQDPPVIFAETPPENTKFNTDLYKPYTQSGETMQYIVWPALLLHEGGSVLARGVAQGFKAGENVQSSDRAGVDCTPNQGDPQVTINHGDVSTKSNGRPGSALVGFEDAHAKKEPTVTHTYSHAVQGAPNPGTQTINKIPSKEQQNVKTRSPVSGSTVCQTEVSNQSLIGTHSPRVDTSCNSNLSASFRDAASSNVMCEPPKQHNLNATIGGKSAGHEIAIPTPQEMSDFYFYWNTGGEHYCRNMMGNVVVNKCIAYHNLFLPKQ